MRLLRSLSLPVCILAALCTPLAARGQTAGQNVNMVSGTKWPGGDPFLQRQNEPSLAVSTRNPIHLLAGANDYRSVDIPNPNSPDERGDAWLGVFKSFDGGATWGSTLLPGYPQDQSAVGMASPLHGFTTAADPVVRAGTNGLFYYSGIAFNRGTNQGQIFFARFMDLNNQEGGDASQSQDPIRYIGVVPVDAGTSGQFLDKPWIAVDMPRGTATCTIQVPQGSATVTQTIPAGNVYVVWSRFTGSTSTKIMFSKSLDCGATWSTPTKLSESNSINQGTTMAIDPGTGNIYVAWRRFVTSSQPDAIVSVKSTDSGKTFTKSIDVVGLPVYNSTTPNAPSFFDQDTASAAIRIHAFPTLAVDGHGTVYLAWSQRGYATGGDARVVMATSADGVTWSANAAVDNGPLTEGKQPVLDASTPPHQLVLGHQVMPQLTFAAGQLFVLYYDLREDHTIGLFQPNNPFGPDASGNFFQESRQPKGELPGNPAQVFTPYLTDANLTLRRHTLDLVVAQADTNKSPLVFTTARVSHYKFGLRNDGTDTLPVLQQLQVNPPNLPLFEQGQVPFLGDYVDIAGLTFLPTDTTGNPWDFNTSPANSPVVYATWTSNQDVRPPADGDWTHYTPVGGGGPSIYNSGASTPTCVTGQEGMRNQNIYMSQITQGLLVSSPQNYKPLNTKFQRAFAIFVQNFTNLDKTFLLTIGNQPPGGLASFVPAQTIPPPASFVATTVLTVAVPAHSGVARMVFATSSAASTSIKVTASELAPGGTLLPGGLSSFALLNPDPTAPALLNPPGSTAGDISSAELFNGSLVNVGVTDPNIDGSLVNSSYFYGSLLNGSLVNADVNSGSLVNGSLVNGSLVNGSLVNGSLVNGSLVNGSLVNGSLVNSNLATIGVASGSLLNTTLANGSLVNGSLVNGSLVNGSLVNGSLVNGPISDVSYTITQKGNTAGAYTIGLIGNPTSSPNLQLIITKTYLTPTSVATSQGGCALAQEPHNVVLSNVNNPVLQDPASTNPADPVITDPGASRSTVVLGPGETAVVTLRAVNMSPADLHNLTTQLGPLVTSHACNTNDPACAGRFAVPLLVTTATLPPGKVDVAYPATQLTNLGGAQPFTWGVSLGTLPGGFTLSSGGMLSGTPTTAGTFTFTVSVSDSSSPPVTANRVLTMTVQKANAVTILASSANPSVFGQQVTISAAVGSGPIFPTGTVNFMDGASALGPVTLNNGVATFVTSALAVGIHSIRATYGGDVNFIGNASTLFSQTVNQANSLTTVTSLWSSAVFGQPLTLTATVTAVAPGVGTPTGVVIFLDNAKTLGTATLSAGGASFTISSLAVGSHSFTTSYGGDANFLASSPSGGFAETINQASASVTVSSTQNPSVFGQPVSLTAIVSAVAPGAGIPTGTVTFVDGSANVGTASLNNGAASFTTSALGAGSHSITASYGGSLNFLGNASGALTQIVSKANTTTTIASIAPNPVVVGQPVKAGFSLTVNAPGSGKPTGTVTVTDGAGASCSAPLPASNCSLTFATVGSKTLTATYSGDSDFAGSSGTLRQQEVVSYVFTGFFTPLATAGTFSSPTNSGTGTLGHAVPVKWSLQDGAGNFISNLNTTTLLQAIFNPSCSGAPTGQSTLLYSPTSGAKGGSTFRFSTNQFIFNWDTSTGVTSGCYTLVLQLNDGSSLKATTILLK